MDQRTDVGVLGRAESVGVIACRSMSEIETKTQLDLLRDSVLLLGGKTEEAVHRAMRSLTERDGGKSIPRRVPRIRRHRPSVGGGASLRNGQIRRHG